MVAAATSSPPSWLLEVPLAHRGLHGTDVPENTEAAFEAARRAAVGVELDVRLSGDGVPVVHHDRTLDRLSGRTAAVADLSAEELAATPVGGTDQGIPSLARVLAAIGPAPVMVELKAEALRPGSLEPAVAAVLADHPGPACIASFNPLTVRWFRRYAPEVVRVLTAAPTTVELGARTVRLANLQSLSMTAPVAVSYDVGGLDLGAVRRHRSRGGVVIAWTIRTPGDLATARAAADNVIFETLPTHHVRGPGAT